MSDERDAQGRAEDLVRFEALVARLLGGPGGDEPTARELVALVRGELAPERRPAVQGYLAAHPEVEAAVRAGLDEAQRLERAPALPATPTLQQIRARLAGAFHGVLRFTAPLPCAAAADEDDDARAPVPEDRQVLAEEPGSGRVTFYRRGPRAFVTIFDEPTGALEVLRCALEEEELAAQRQAGATTFALGPATRLAGKRLLLVLRCAGADCELSWTLVTT